VVSQYQAHRAQQRFDAVRGLANEVLFGVDSRLRPIPGTAGARQELVQIVLRHLERLAQDTGGDAGLEAELATAYQRAGSLQATVRNAGDPRESLRKAVDLGERARASGNRDPRLLGILAKTHFYLGIDSYQRGNNDQARASLLGSIDKAKILPAAHGGAAIISTSSRWLGRIEMEAGQVSRAVEWMEESVRTGEQALLEDPSPSSSQELVGAQFYLVRALRLAGDLSRAEEVTLTAARRGEATYQANPENNDARLAYLAGYAGAGSAAVPADIPLSGITAEETARAVDLAKRMTLQEPATNSWTTWLIMAYDQQSFFATDARVAELSATNALSIAEKHLTNTASNAISIRNVAESRIHLAEARRRTGDRVGAVEQATLAVRELSAGFKDREAKAGILRATLLLATVHLDGHDRQRAAERLEPARQLAEALVASDPTDMRMRAFLALTYEGLGQCAAGPAAVDWFSKSAQLWKSWPVFKKPSEYPQGHLRHVEQLLADARQASAKR